MNNIENNICEAIELIVDKAVNKAEYDKTIQAVIHSCVDATIGKYKVTYQDSSFYAYSPSTDVTYPNGSMVYILIPGNDMNKDKTILGTVEKLGINYIPQIEEDEAYDIIGSNCIISTNKYHISSYSKPNNNTSYVKVIYYYDETTHGHQGDLQIDTVALQEYIKESPSLICGGTFKTSLPAEQQYQGNYGIIFGVDFFDNANGNATGSRVTRYYTVDVDNMTGNPYQLKLGKRQFGIFDIDGANFDKISSISLFVKDFPHSKNEEEIAQQNLYDIEVSNIEFFGAAHMSESDLNGCGISFYTPNGTFFPATATEHDTLPLIAQVKIKGKIVDSQSQKIPFYWFQEDASIVPKSEKYNKYGGRGWRCLNNYNLIDTASDDSTKQVDWIPAGSTYKLLPIMIPAQEAKFKCAIVYNGAVYSKTIVIKNLQNKSVLTIESNLGTQFYYDIGRPTLTCYVDKKPNIDYVKPSGYTYVWAVEDSYGNVTNLPIDPIENTQIHHDYQQAIQELEQLKNDIATGNRLPNEAANELQQKQDLVDSFKDIQYVYDNELRQVAINEITKFATYKCAVFKGDNYIGTTSIKLSNTLEVENAYTLVINNGTQTYQYNEYGLSPASNSSENPLQIPVLSFSVFDNLGKPLDEAILKHCDIKWKIPIKNTMLTNIKADGTVGPPDPTQEYQYYYNTAEIVYGIQNKYYYNYRNNNIELTVNYKGMNLTATTNLSFVKTGEAGTNGTEYTCKIVPNNKTQTFSLYPMFTVVEGVTREGKLNFKYLEDNNNQTDIITNGYSNGAPFIVKLYKSGEEIFSGAVSGVAKPDVVGANIPVTVSWEMLANHYKNSINDYHDLTIEKNSGKIKYEGQMRDCPAHIIKCTVYYGSGDNRYCVYATLPLITATVKNSSYHISLKENTGFRNVIYTTDGVRPQYDTTKPFEIEVTQKINGIDEIISLSPNPEYGINTFEWSVQGQEFDYSTQQLIPSNNLINQNSDVYVSKLQANQRWFKPSVTYSGLCVTNAVVCKCSAGTIHIPIHFLLNKYGFAHLNSWDGNSIQLDENGGFILSPQMGAGIKTADNAFTGVLMGKVQEPTRKTADIGLLGYNNGVRTFKLDSENGAAILGAGQGQIVIDPASHKALLYSRDYWKTYNENGLPSSYADSNINRVGGKGMLIDLTTPRIDFANGNFSVDPDGKVVIAGKGMIAGWNIDDTALFTGKKNENTNVQIASSSFSRSINGVTRDNLRLAVNNKFAVSSDGTMYAGDAIIGTGSNKISIGKSSGNAIYSALYSGNKNSLSADASGFYLGTDGLALGNTFSVSSAGIMTATSGTIANWTIADDKLCTNGKTWHDTGTSSDDGMYLGSEGIYLGKTFWVTSKGDLTARSGTIANWTITSNSLCTNGKTWTDPGEGIYLGSEGIYLGGNFWVHQNGSMTAKSGTIGGWEIQETYLRSKNKTMYIDSNGSMYGPSWSISADGTATFNKVNITGGSVAGNTVGQGVAGGNINSGSISRYKFDSGVETWVGDIAANEIKAATIKADQITSGTMSADRISGGILSGVSIKGGSINIADGAFRVDAATGTIWVCRIMSAKVGSDNSFSGKDATVQFGTHKLSFINGILTSVT